MAVPTDPVAPNGTAACTRSVHGALYLLGSQTNTHTEDVDDWRTFLRRSLRAAHEVHESLWFVLNESFFSEFEAIETVPNVISSKVFVVCTDCRTRDKMDENMFAEQSRQRRCGDHLH